MSKPEPHHRVRPVSVARARDLRKKSTPPERVLWGLLRNGRLGGLKFRRQQPIGPFVVDFFCAETRLVIELDGRSHDDQGNQDARRTEYLEKQGLTVMRVSNRDLAKAPDVVVMMIAAAAGLKW